MQLVSAEGDKERLSANIDALKGERKECEKLREEREHQLTVLHAEFSEARQKHEKDLENVAVQVKQLEAQVLAKRVGFTQTFNEIMYTLCKFRTYVISLLLNRWKSWRCSCKKRKLKPRGLTQSCRMNIRPHSILLNLKTNCLSWVRLRLSS